MNFTYLLKLHYSVILSKQIGFKVLVLPSWFLRQTYLKPQLKALKGSLMGVNMAMEIGWAINLGGGFHHARLSHGEGFCAYPDISLTVLYA